MPILRGSEHASLGAYERIRPILVKGQQKRTNSPDPQNPLLDLGFMHTSPRLWGISSKR